MANHTNLNDLFTGIADAIREKTGGTDELVADNFPQAITDMPSGGVEVGDITSSARADFLAEVGTKYIACNGQVLNPYDYPELAEVVELAAGGVTWYNTPITTSLPTNYDINSSCMTREGRWFITTSLAVYYSDDKGSTWTKNNPGGKTSLNGYAKIHQTKTGRLIFYYYGNDYYVSDDLGETWVQKSNHGLYATWSLTNMDSGRIVTLTSGGTAYNYSDDDGETWNDLGPWYGETCLFKLDNNRLLRVYESTGYISDDEGATWTSSYNYAPAFYGITGTDDDDNDIYQSYGITVGKDGVLIATLYADDMSYAWLMRSTNNGESWSDVTEPYTTNSQASTVRVFSTKSGRFYCWYRQTNNTSYMKYSDNGTTWYNTNVICGNSYIIMEECPDSTLVSIKYYRGTADYGASSFNDAAGGRMYSPSIINVPNMANHYLKVKK